MYQGSAVEQTQPVRTTEVQGAHEVLLKNCQELSMVTADLESRLHPVLAQRLEGQASNSSAPEPIRVPVAQMIYECSAQVESNIKALRSIIDRLEV